MRNKLSLTLSVIMISILIASISILLLQNKRIMDELVDLDVMNTQLNLMNAEKDERIINLDKEISDHKHEISQHESTVQKQNEMLADFISEDNTIEYEKPWRSILVMSPNECEDYVGDLSAQIIEILDSGEYSRITEFIHPRAGLRFSPYTCIDLDMDLVFSREEFREALEINQSFLWGYQEGSGKEISLSILDYFESYLYPADYHNEADVDYSDPVNDTIYNGNHYYLYFDPAVVEFFYQDLDSEYHGADWTSLKLVFEEYEDEWYLINFVSNYWTP